MQKMAGEDGDISEFTGLDRLFHLSLFKAAGVFSLIVCTLLLYDYSRRRADDPLDDASFLALKIALPALAALIVVNLSFGVMSRAAPTLNLFAVGFPVAMLLGFVVVFLNMGGLQENVALFLSETLSMLPTLLGR